MRQRSTPPPRAARALQIAVVVEGPVWRILIDQHPVGRFERRQDAITGAVRVARLSQEEGRAVELLIHDPFGELTTAQRLAA